MMRKGCQLEVKKFNGNRGVAGQEGYRESGKTLK